MSANNIYFPQIDIAEIVNKDNYIVIDDKKTGLPRKVNIIDFMRSLYQNGLMVEQFNFDISVLFEDATLLTYRAPRKFKVVSVDNPDSITYSIEVNGNPYVLGNTINLYDTMSILPSAPGFIVLRCQMVL